jgi:hypothetical protein
VEQFSFECCPLLQEISFAIHCLPCFEGGLCCVCFLGVQLWEFISLPCPLSLGHIVFDLSPALSLFNYSLRFGFQFCLAVLFWKLLSG